MDQVTDCEPAEAGADKAIACRILLGMARQDADEAIQTLATLALRVTTAEEAEAIRAAVGPLVCRLQAIEVLCIEREIRP